jgi:tripartite-type tricarboxylate transporter receptor subunit TctC
MMQKVPYDAQKDFVPISIFGTGNYILATKPALPVKSLAEFIAYAKERPGKLNYASVGPGGLQHLGIALLAQRAGIDMVHVPYNSTMAVSALMSGDVDLYLGTSGEMMNAGADKVKRLAVGSTKRIPQLPDLPTIAETLPGFRVAGWNGMFAPAGTPPEIVTILAKEIGDLARDPAMAQKLTELGIEPVGNTPAEFADVIRTEHASYREALKTTGLLKE